VQIQLRIPLDPPRPSGPGPTKPPPKPSGPQPLSSKDGLRSLRDRHRCVVRLGCGRVLSTRIVRTVINGRDTYRLQLVIDGHPTRRHPVGNGRVSLDMGPSQIAVAVEQSDGTSTGWIEPLADRIRLNPLRLRRQQRHLDRQHRTGTPDCFKPDGTHQSGRCQWERSHAAKQTTNRVAEQHRRLAQHRQTLHGAPVNRLLSHGADVVCEKLLAQCARSGTGVAR
jgi:putative transposase